MTTIKFLLVDDEKHFVEILAERLRQKGFVVHCAFSGIEALNQLENNKEIDIVVIDEKMPGLDGIETIKQLKIAHPLVEVIMLTGHSKIPSAVEAIKIGAFDYLSKPCDLNRLICRAKQAISRKRDRESRIFDIRTKLYITKQERDELISQVLES
jgi:DNA-binding NtrC family response regulator